MKKSRFTEEQIAFALKQAELGTKVDEICRKMGISDATFYKWRKSTVDSDRLSYADSGSLRKRTISSSAWSPI